MTLRYGLGWVILGLGLGGAVLALGRRSKPDWVLLSLLAAFYAVIGQGKAVFFRYALPMVPLLCVCAGLCVDRLRKQAPVGYAGLLGVALITAGLAEPLWASVRLNTLLNRPDTRVLARGWIEANISSGQQIKNMGGLYGDVPVRNKSGMSWWLARYCRAFPEVSGLTLAAYLSGFSDRFVPVYQYTIYPGLDDLIGREQGKKAAREIPSGGWVITHEHPLPYSNLDAEFLTWLGQEAHLMAQFSPGPEPDLKGAVLDRQDAFYYPIGRFGRLERGGPVVRIWQIKDAQEPVLEAEDVGRMFGWIFLSMGNVQYRVNDLERAALFYRRASEILVEYADIHVLLGRVYFQQRQFEAGVAAFEQAAKQGARLSGEVYESMGAFHAAAGRFEAAINAYEQAFEKGYETAAAYNNMGAAYFQTGQLERAGQAIRRALELDADHVGARANLEAVEAEKTRVP